ncbi:MAG: ATP-binding cassette domain-containing protein, partial [Spirochaetaceae bacterium]|nr:ATP-binding cassette domain-containing protein [Spirochaetaceae bacterium]
MSVSCIEMKTVTKFFPSNAVHALEGTDFCLKSGEIHALIGENGAGKSTLMRILAGHLRPDSGKIFIDGLERSFFSPADALAAGIGMVSQKPELSPSLSVWEDCSLGIEQGVLREKIARAPLPALYRTVWRGLSLFALYRKKARERVKDCAEREGINLDPDAHCDFLSAAERQMAGVLALLLRQTRFLIFDEPTAVLSAADSRRLFALWERLASQGRGIVVISHKLNEVRSFADRITVLRKGKRAASFDASSCSDEKLVSVMFGGKANVAPAESRGSAGHRGGSVRDEQDKGLYAGKPAGKAILNVTGLSIRDKTYPFLRNICFTVEAGKILGVLGIKESGIETLELGLAGFLSHFSGRFELDGVDISGGGPRSFRAAGGVYLSAGK